MSTVLREFTFHDRVHAGRLLGDALMKYAGQGDIVVLGLPRGGVPVAYEVAQKLRAPMDVLVVRKVGLPQQQELAMGAVASGGIRVVNDDVVRRARVPKEVFDAAAAKELAEVQRREIRWRGHTGAPKIEGRTVILVDDGIATGSTVRAAARALKLQKPARVIIAAPVAAPDSVQMLGAEADEVFTLMQPESFHAVGQWYEDFSATEDEEVAKLLADSASRHAASM
jgi:putative phosphoribosyl transferase